jgi:hypothetical protein
MATKEVLNQKNLDALSKAAKRMTPDPTPDMVRVKTAWYALMRESKLFDNESFSMVDVANALNNPRVLKWSKDEAWFDHWFKNEHAPAQEMEYLFTLGMDALKDLLQSRDPKAYTSQVNAMKWLGEMTRRAPPKTTQTKILDKSIPSDKQELQEFVRREQQKLHKIK